MDAGENGDLAAMTPPQVLDEFFAAVKDGDKTRAYACLPQRSMFNMLMVNKNPDCLYNPTAGENNSLVGNILGERVISTSYYEPGVPANSFTDIGGRTSIGVHLELEGLKWRDQTFNTPDGRDTRFTYMYNNGNGWKLDELATGP